MNAMAVLFNDRSVGDGLELDSNKLLQLAIAADGGLEFSSGDLTIKYPADGGVKTSSVGLEVDMSGMAAQATPAEADLFLVEDSGGTDAKEKVTLAQLRDAIIDPPADGAIKNTAELFEVDISGMAAQASPAEGDLFLIEDSGGSDAKEKVTLTQLRDAVIDPPADGGLKNTNEVFEVDISGMAANTNPAEADLILIEDSGGTDAKEKVTVANLRKTFEQPYTIETITATDTLDAANLVVICNSASALTVNLPAANTETGLHYHIKNINTGVVTVDPDGVETIDDLSTVTLNQYDAIHIITDGTEWWIL
jgi:hypothetical protein